MRRTAALAALALVCCDGDAAPSKGVVVAEEARYRIVARSTSPPSREAAGELLVRIETRGGWHVAEEAPARLDLASAQVVLEPDELRVADARSVGQDLVEFATSLRARQPGAATATGRVKFGICEGPRAKCLIVRRELEIPLDIAFDD